MRNDAFDEALDSIMSRKYDYYRIAHSFCGNRDDSLDAVSEMTAIVIEKFGKLKDRNAFTAWSTSILINECRKCLRQRKRTVFIEDLPIETGDADTYPDDDDLTPDMQLALASIRPSFREVVILKELLDYSYREIATMLHIPVGTAQSRYNYGIKRLRKELEGYHNEKV
jgi:RNA polymerase sigma-70 factor (ECF subfamily)